VLSPIGYLSHQLNNPAAAAQRAAFSLSSKIDRIRELCSLGRLSRSDEELANYIEWTERSLGAIEKEVTAGMDAEGIARTLRDLHLGPDLRGKFRRVTQMIRTASWAARRF
jgi:hypothetical protein